MLSGKWLIDTKDLSEGISKYKEQKARLSELSLSGFSMEWQ
jgi:hypothetical protein